MPTSLSTPQTLPTGYTDKATLGPIENLEKIVWQNTGGVVVFQVGRLDPAGRPVFDQTEAALPPGIWGMDRIYGIRFRSRDVAALATIDPVTGYFADDPDPFNPGNIPGSTTAITGALNFQHNDALVASQPTADFEDSADGSFAWSVNNDAPGNRVKITPPNVVTSAFGRTGVVTAQSGDYLAAQVTNAADKASAAAQIFSGSVSTGPANNGRSTVGAFLETATGRVLTTASAAGVTSMFATAVVGDAQWRWTMDSNGVMTWGTGAALGDTSLQRVSSNPPSGTAIGLQTNNPFTVNDANGLKVIQAVNSSALSCWLLNTDAQPAFKIFAQGAMIWGPGGSTVPDIELARIVNGPTGTGSFMEFINGDGFGYGTGCGASVTQLTSKSTAVTINAPTGKITMFASTGINGSGGTVTFQVNCTQFGLDDLVIVNVVGPNTGLGQYTAWVTQSGVSGLPSAGHFLITVRNDGITEGVAVVIQYAIIKGAHS